MPVVRNVNELQNVLKGWMRRPNESDEEYRNRINDPSNEISFDLFGLRDMVTEQIENERFNRARQAEPAIPDECFQSMTPAVGLDLEAENKALDTVRGFFDKVKEIDVILTEAN